MRSLKVIVIRMKTNDMMGTITMKPATTNHEGEYGC